MIVRFKYCFTCHGSFIHSFIFHITNSPHFISDPVLPSCPAVTPAVSPFSHLTPPLPPTHLSPTPYSGLSISTGPFPLIPTLLVCCDGFFLVLTTCLFLDLAFCLVHLPDCRPPRLTLWLLPPLPLPGSFCWALIKMNKSNHCWFL